MPHPPSPVDAPATAASRLTGGCHCGAVRFALALPDGLGQLNRCNCSLCRKRRAVMASVPLAALQLLDGAAALTLYQWNSHVAEHWFCRVCGIYTHHRRRSRPDHYAVNVACLDGEDVTAGRTIGMLDGAANPLCESR